MKLLLLSNSTTSGHGGYLEWAINDIKDFFKDVKKGVFIPYAGISINWDSYTQRVNDAVNPLGIELTGIHESSDPVEAIKNASSIWIGGGNTWNLLKTIQENALVDAIRQRVLQDNVPYIGWSAGSNLACPTICTTNDMPITEPKSFNAFSFIPFQINPHYLDAASTHGGGETRDDRINEFLIKNPSMPVLGVREGLSLHVENSKMTMKGLDRQSRLFQHGQDPKELNKTDDLTFLL